MLLYVVLARPAAPVQTLAAKEASPGPHHVKAHFDTTMGSFTAELSAAEGKGTAVG